MRTTLAKAAKPVWVNQLTRLPCLVVHDKPYKIPVFNYEVFVFWTNILLFLVI